MESKLLDSPARQATLIYNPTAGFWDWSTVIAKVARFWAGEGWTLHIESTRYTGHATELARQAAAANHRLVFAAGGDGTLNEVANGLVGTASALAPMPVGTANSFAKELGLPRPNVLYPDFLLEVSQALARGRVQAMDVGYIETAAAPHPPQQSEQNGEHSATLPNERQGRYWLLWASTGIDGFIVDQIEPRPRWFKYLGTAGYAARALSMFPQFHGLHAHITVDGQTLEGDFLLINVSNCRMWLGGELRLNQNGVLDDGMFELWLFRGKDWPQLFSYGLEITREEHSKNPHVTVLRCHEVRVTTTPNMAYQLDGEPVAETPFTSSIRRGALLLLAPDSVPAGLFTLPGQPLEVS
jgi:YegS/Rv2252/BmrU family lipid kinase